MANNYHKLTDGQLNELFKGFLDVVGAAPVTYGVTAGNITALTNYQEQFGDAITGLVVARAAAKGATQTRDTTRQDALVFFSQLLATIYHNPSVTDTMLADAGLAPRDTNRTKKVPYQPTNLNAVPTPSGTVTLTWEANGNTYGVAYVVEYQAPGAETWNFLGTSFKRRETYSGFAPGTEVWFRVTATRNSLNSEPSYPASIYTPASVPALKIAA